MLYEQACLSNGSLSLQRVLNRINAILTERGYRDRRRFLTPTGFGLSTNFERITNDGRPLEQQRFDTTPFYNGAWQVLTGNTRPGRYRSFVITFGGSIPEASEAKVFTEMVQLAGARDFALPADVQQKKGRQGDHIEVFIYEYARPALHMQAKLVQTLQASEHMAGSGLGPKFDRICARAE
jgi:hypothetical protein